jgi:hypothetical protein
MAQYEVYVNETNSVEENAMLPEPGFLMVSCNHSDNLDVEYSLLEEDIPFSINTMTGELMVLDDLDYETTTMYNLTAICTVTNNPNLTDSSTIVVFVLPVNEHRPRIDNPTVLLQIDELTPIGLLPSTVIGTAFNIIDLDEPRDTIFYSFDLNDTAIRDITVAYNETLQGLVLKQPYDRESLTRSQDCSPYGGRITMTACDIYPQVSACPNVEFLVLLHATNDNDPIFSQARYSTEVEESASINSTLLSVTCTDQDICTGEFDGIEILNKTSDRFSINQDGIIMNTELLDYEESPNYTLTLRCFDDGPHQREAFATVEIQLTDTNDNTPECSTSSVIGHLTVGSHERTSVLRLSCVDDDAGINSQLTYTVDRALPQVPGGRFRLDESRGELLFSGELRFNQNFSFSIDVSDSGLPPRSSTVQVRVSVTGEEEVLPTMGATQELPMLLIIVVCTVGGLLLICCAIFLLTCCWCFCAQRHRKKTKKVVL